MQNSGKKLHRQSSVKLCVPKKEFESKVNNPIHNKNGCKNIKRCNGKPKSHAKAVGSLLLKRKVLEIPNNGAKNNSSNEEPIRKKVLHKKFSDANTTEKQLSSMLHGGKVDRDEKNNDMTVETQKLERRRRRKKRKKNRELDDASRLLKRTRYLLIKIKLEQNLIDAYSGEGWNGQSREKIKPEKELQRAEEEILKCKLGIRDAIRQLECLSSEGCLENSVVDPDGSVFHEHIFCAKCKLGDAFQDNDIILCDGTCNCAFHQKCLEPPLATENIPPEDQGWFCKFCECKMEILEVTNAHLGTQFSANSKWQDIFWEAAMSSGHENASLNPEDEWPSDDSEDDDYDPDSRTATEENMSGGASSSHSLLCTSEEEEEMCSSRLGTDGGLKRNMGKRSGQSDKINYVDSSNSLDSLDSADLISKQRRQRRDVDYKKLHDEMFGKDMPENEQYSEDEDWGPHRRKRRGNESDATGSLVAVCGMNVMPVEDEEKSPSVPQYKRRLFRIPPNAVEKLRKVFAENELPPRAVRENLSKHLGIPSEKINKWFKNARYAALRIRKTQTSDPVASKDNRSYLVPSAAVVQRSKILRKAYRRKNKKSISSPLKKKRRRRAADASPEVSSWSSKSVNLNKPISSFRRKSAAKNKSTNSTSSVNNEQLYMVEMERICGLKDKFEKMKAVLRTCNDGNDSDGSHLDERPVIYVPVAEVREKV